VDTDLEGESTAAATSDFRREVLTRETFFVRFTRAGFFDGFGVRTIPSPTSANTSNIHRTRRPARSAGILIACFGIAALYLLSHGNSRARGIHAENWTARER
jgi:hypothetical protein